MNFGCQTRLHGHHSALYRKGSAYEVCDHWFFFGYFTCTLVNGWPVIWSKRCVKWIHLFYQAFWTITADSASFNLVIVTYINNGLQDTIHNKTAACLPEACDDHPIVVSSSSTNNLYFLTCMAHTPQLGIKHALKRGPVIDGEISRFQELINAITASHKIVEALANMCASLKVANKTPELECDTRWNRQFER